ncbi:MAG: hypothetical protein C0518_13285 [Opitutus sp.]|nr:hypothetical protein [Opitutus sp.]
MQNETPIVNPAATRALPLHDTIAARAYELWEGYGRPAGRDVAIWLEAERQLLGTDPQVNHNGAPGAVAAPQLAEATAGGKKKRPRQTPELATNTGR